MGRRRKQVVPGKVWAVDRRTTRRYFLFRPDAARRIEDAFWYCLAVCANEFGIKVHAATLMSTHMHVIYTDTRGVQPTFKREFHRMFAHCVKGILCWPEEVFKPNTAGGEHEPLTEDALIKDLAYLIANSVSAFAVRYAKDWPGAKTLPRDIGRRVIRTKRPNVYLDPNNPRWPEVAELELTMPESLDAAYGLEGACKRIAEAVKRLEHEAWEEARRSGIAFKGARRVLRTPHTVRARSYEVFGKINPRFSAAGDRKAAAAKVRALRQFDAEYDAALARWTSGDRRAVFPYGTWWMRVHHHARVRPPP
jgi:hypothetical protein